MLSVVSGFYNSCTDLLYKVSKLVTVQEKIVNLTQSFNQTCVTPLKIL